MFQIVPADLVLFVGDSLINGEVTALAPGWPEQMMFTIQLQQLQAYRATVASLQRAGIKTPAAAVPNFINFVVDGIAGSGVANLAANPARITGHGAVTKVVWPPSVNDLGLVGAAWTTPASTVAATIASVPSIKQVLMLGVPFGGPGGTGGEKWKGGTAGATGWGENANDAAVATLNSTAQAFAAAHGYEWLDIRGVGPTPAANTILNYEAAHNAGDAATGIITVDGIHPSNPFGQQVVAAMVKAGIQVSL